MRRRWKAPIRHARGKRGDTVHACKPIVKHHLLFHFDKSQSAMEYLMTYGWAILIIAVVLGALFQLGVFNANNFAPKAPPGACQVFRPNGPGTTSFINLEGVCSGELPQYVSYVSGTGTSYVETPSISTPASVTLAAWVQLTQTQPSIGVYNRGVFTENDMGVGNTISIGFSQQPSSTTAASQQAECFVDSNPQHQVSSSAYMNLSWTFLACTFNSATSNAILYVNGAMAASVVASGFTPTGHVPLWIGMDAGGRSMSGFIANAQIYNTSLSANEIQALYLEGIGGAPIDLQNLVGWWPLNGNANDYSGNGNNGQATNVIYTGSWTSGYTPP
jgi:hypothetical protein